MCTFWSPSWLSWKPHCQSPLARFWLKVSQKGSWRGIWVRSATLALVCCSCACDPAQGRTTSGAGPAHASQPSFLRAAPTFQLLWRFSSKSWNRLLVHNPPSGAALPTEPWPINTVTFELCCIYIGLEYNAAWPTLLLGQIGRCNVVIAY